MAANKHKAEQFIREVEKFAYEQAKRLEIEVKDIHLVCRVDVLDRVSFDFHEDED